MASLVLFEEFSGKFSPNFKCFTKCNVFCSHSFDYACLKVLRQLRHIVMKRFEITEKFYSSTALLKMAGEGMHPSHAPLDPPMVNM